MESGRRSTRSERVVAAWTEAAYKLVWESLDHDGDAELSRSKRAIDLLADEVNRLLGAPMEATISVSGTAVRRVEEQLCRWAPEEVERFGVATVTAMLAHPDGPYLAAAELRNALEGIATDWREGGQGAILDEDEALELADREAWLELGVDPDGPEPAADAYEGAGWPPDEDQAEAPDHFGGLGWPPFDD